MFTASQRKKENIAEYLLYMWQIEDLIRANGLDMDNIDKNIIDQYTDLSDQQRRDLYQWYESLIDMMRREGVEHSGHLQINRNTLTELSDLHSRLMADPRFNAYSQEFYRVLPYIVELRAKAGDNRAGELETCFTALYGMLLMRLRKQNITPETTDAIHVISRFIALLARNFHLDEAGQLFKPKDSSTN